MTADSPTPLATADQFNSGAFKDLAASLQPGDLDQIMIDATRACEDECGRRLAPFTITETQRLEAGDLEDGAGLVGLLPPAAQMGRDYANSLGIGAMARHCWLREYPVRYQDLWTGALVQFQVYWSFQLAPYVIPPTSVQYDVDTGHIQFTVGTFVPFGATGKATYSGGYSTIPAGLVRACKSMAASIIIKELDPNLGLAHDPELLRDEALQQLNAYMRDPMARKQR